MAAVYSLFAIAFFVLNQGTMFKGAGKIIAMASGGGISPNGVVVAMTAAVLLYSFFGGLIAAAYTDFIQGFLIIALSFMLIPAGLARVGGFAGMHALLPRHFFDLYNETSGVDAFGIAMLAVNGLIGVTAMPHMLSLTATGRTEAQRTHRQHLRHVPQTLLHHRLGADRADRRRHAAPLRRVSTTANRLSATPACTCSGRD